MVGQTTIIRRWGSWNEALVAAALRPIKPHTTEFLIEQLRRKATTLNRTPGSAEVERDRSLPSLGVYIRRFGSYPDACTAAGLDIARLKTSPGTYSSGLDRHLRVSYGITEADYWRMHAEQGGLCAICRLEETWVSNMNGEVVRLSVDHCHATGEVRGLLCNRCNNALGRLGEDVELLRAMVGYLADDRPVLRLVRGSA